jgi:toxin HigB-1
MIKTYADKATKQLFTTGKSKKFQADIIRRAILKLELLDTAVDVDDLLIPPSNALETLSGNRAGQHSIRINRQSRICFTFANGGAYDVEITDYH